MVNACSVEKPVSQGFAGPAAAPPQPSSPRRTIAVVGSGRPGAPAPRHPRSLPLLTVDEQRVFDRADRENKRGPDNDRERGARCGECDAGANSDERLPGMLGYQTTKGSGAKGIRG